MTPARIQMRRTKGWRMPANTAYVGRPTRWGNPWRVGEPLYQGGEPLTAEGAVGCFEAWIYSEAFECGQDVHEFTSALRGKNLACWCKPGARCHADVLLKMANPV